MQEGTHMDTRISENLAGLVILALLEETPERTGGVTHLRMGATAKTEGYRSEDQYLASQRRNAPMRVRGTERNSYRRWMSPSTELTTILEGSGARFGNGAARRQRARANAARFWYGVPRISLGA